MHHTRFLLIFLFAFLALYTVVPWYKKQQHREQFMQRKLLASETPAASHKDYRDMTDAEYQEWCNELEHVSIYSLGAKLNCNENTQTFSVALMACVFLTVMIELLMHKIRHSIRNLLHKEVMNKVIKELMILGLISFAVNVLESAHFFELVFEAFHTSTESLKAVTERRVKLFELVHIVIFVLSIFYVLTVIVSYFLVRRAWRKWKLYEETGEKVALERFRELNENWLRQNSVLRYFNIVFWYRWYNINDLLSYWGVRVRFLHVNKLPTHYRFDYYLRQRIRMLYVNLIEVSWKVWLVIFFAALANYFRVKIVTYRSFDSGLLIFGLAFGLGPILCMLFIYLSSIIGYQLYVRKYTYKKQAQMKDDSFHEKLLTPDDELHLSVADDKTETTETIRPKDNKTVQYDVNMKKYFPLRLPKVMFTLIQLGQLSASFYFAMMVTHYYYIVLYEPLLVGGVAFRIFIFLLTSAPYFVNLLILFPNIIAPFTIISSVESLTNIRLVKLAYKLQKTNNPNNYGQHEEEEPYFNSVSHTQKKVWRKFISVEQAKLLKRRGRKLQRQRLSVISQQVSPMPTTEIPAATPTTTTLEEQL